MRQIIKEHTGLSAKDLQAARGAARQQLKVQRARDLASDDANLALNELATRSGLSVWETEAVLGAAESARRRRERNVTTGSERDRALGEVRRVASLPGGVPLSGPFYDQHRGEGLSSARLVQIFGTWATACKEAGVEAPSAARSNYTQGWSREDCLRWVLEYHRSAHRPTNAGYESWARGQDGAPSAGTVRLRCGKWIPTVRDAYALEAGGTLESVEDAGGRSGVAADSSTPPPLPLAPTGEVTPEEDLSTDGQAAFPTALSGQGRQSELELRLKVEMAAQERLMAYYRSGGWQVTDTHLGSPYDAVAKKDGETLFLEAKGTQSAGATVLLTRGEVEHARAQPGRCFIGIWSGIRLDESGAVSTDSGNFRVMPFNPQPDELVVVGYEWRPE